MQHRLKYLYILVTFILLSTNIIYAKADLACEEPEQPNGTISARWKCPGLNGTKLDATLSELDVGKGTYTCEYRYPDTQQVATVCSYLSIGYKENLDKTLEEVHKSLVETISKNGSFSANRTTFNGTPGVTNIGYLDSFRGDKQYDIENSYETDILDEIDTTLGRLQDYFNKINDANGYLYELDKTNTKNPLKALKDSYKSFVEPYINGGTEERNVTFSHFVTGLVTLDDEIAEGYDGNTGKLKVASKWMDQFPTSTKDLLAAIRNYFSASNTLNPENNVSKWAEVFTQKVWGFYFNLQSRLDIGYDIISTQLLFIMMVFFSIMMAVRGGARYIINRENGESSGEVKINEASIMKTLGILATVFAFYISVPYDDDKSIRIGGEPTQKIRTNASLSKMMIRAAMATGADFGTMISDLGTDAFLRFIVQQQGANNGITEGDNVIKSIMSLVYYYPAYEVVNACRYQTGLSDDRIFSGQGSVAISSEFSEDSKKPHPPSVYSLYEENNITLISDGVCRQMIAQTADTFHDISYTLETLLARIEDDKYLRMNATFNLVENHIKLQEQLGWMNIASIPYTYFLMKNQNLFYESRVDFAVISEKSKKYAKNLGLRSGQDAIDSTMWIKNITETKKRLALGGEDKKDMVKQYTRLAIYNFLPGFSSIRNEVLQRIQSLFSDILRMRRTGVKDTRTLSNLVSFLNTMSLTAQAYYGPIKNLFDISKMKKKLTSAIGADGSDGDPIILHQIFYQISYLVAMAIWKSGFIIVFLSAIAMIIGIKIVLYIINIMVHFFISPFIVVWAFATSPDGGASKIKNYLRDTLIYMLYPTIIVIGVFMFIFAYELFYSIYGFITSMLIEGQTKVMENAALTTYHASNTDVEMGFLAVHALKDITEILIDLLSVYVAFLTINKFPELVLKMMGVGDSAVIMLPQASEAIQSKGGGSVNPLSR